MFVLLKINTSRVETINNQLLARYLCTLDIIIVIFIPLSARVLIEILIFNPFAKSIYSRVDYNDTIYRTTHRRWEMILFDY